MEVNGISFVAITALKNENSALTSLSRNSIIASLDNPRKQLSTVFIWDYFFSKEIAHKKRFFQCVLWIIQSNQDIVSRNSSHR